jgi:putative ABC transport system permease protein
VLQAWRVALRPWLRRPGLAAAVVVSLALSMALGITMSAVLDAVHRQAAVFPNGPALVRPMRVETPEGASRDVLPVTGYAAWRTATEAFATLAAYQRLEASVVVDSGVAVRTAVARVSGNLFDTLGVVPTAGRLFGAGDEGVTPCAAVLTRRSAGRLFGGEPKAVERTISVDGQSCRVVGVIDDRQAFPGADVDLFTPLSARALFTRDARGRTAVSIAQVQIIGRPRSDAHRDALLAEATRYFDAPAHLVPFNDALTASYRRTVELLWLCSLVVLAVAVFNVAAIMATHAVTRLGEWGVKGALGASIRAIWRETTHESAVVCLSGAFIGFGLAYASIDMLRASGPREMTDAAVSWQTALVWTGLTAGLTVATSLPACWQASRLSKLWSPGGDGRSAGAAVRSPAVALLGPVLLVLQLGCAIGLVAVTLLFATTLRQMFFAPRGFEADQVMMIPTYRDPGEPEPDRYAQRIETARQTLLGLAQGVEVAVATDVPVPLVQRAFSMKADDEARGVVMHGEFGSARLAAVGPGYFTVLGIPVLVGREFGEHDGPGETRLAIVSESLARAWFGSTADALGQPIRVASVDEPAVVVGVVRDVRRSVWDAHELPVIYVHHAHVVHTPGAPSSARDLLLLVKGNAVRQRAELLRAALTRSVPGLQIGQVRSIRDARLQEVAQTTTYLGVASCFAVVTVLLVALGVFAAAAHIVGRRSGELAIRQAVGATPAEARRALAVTVVKWWAGAVVVAVPATTISAKLVAASQVGLAPMTLPLLGCSIAVMTATLFVAAWVPLRQALRVEPALLLRRE